MFWKIGQLWNHSFFIPKPKFTAENVPDLSGNVVIVTGGNTGIGKETVKVRSNTVFLSRDETLSLLRCRRCCAGMQKCTWPLGARAKQTRLSQISRASWARERRRTSFNSILPTSRASGKRSTRSKGKSQSAFRICFVTYNDDAQPGKFVKYSI